jgi:hypothetical protein
LDEGLDLPALPVENSPVGVFAAAEGRKAPECIRKGVHQQESEEHIQF